MVKHDGSFCTYPRNIGKRDTGKGYRYFMTERNAAAKIAGEFQ